MTCTLLCTLLKIAISTALMCPGALIVQCAQKPFVSERSSNLAMPISPPSLEQMAAKMVVLKELPTGHLPKKMKEDFWALSRLPGYYKVTKTSTKVAGFEFD